MEELHIRVGGMNCRRCVREVTARLRDVAGVELVTAHLDDGLIVIAGKMARDDVAAALEASTHDAEIIAMEPPSPG